MYPSHPAKHRLLLQKPVLISHTLSCFIWPQKHNSKEKLGVSPCTYCILFSRKYVELSNSHYESPMHTNSSNDLISFKPQSLKVLERLTRSPALIPNKSTNQVHPLIELYLLEALQRRCVLTETGEEIWAEEGRVMLSLLGSILGSSKSQRKPWPKGMNAL